MKLRALRSFMWRGEDGTREIFREGEIFEADRIAGEFLISEGYVEEVRSRRSGGGGEDLSGEVPLTFTSTTARRAKKGGDE